jgi:hypothetical protein
MISSGAGFIVLFQEEKSFICLGYPQYAGQSGNAETTYALRRRK